MEGGRDEAVLLQAGWRAAGWAGQQQQTAAERHRRIQLGGDTVGQGGGTERQDNTAVTTPSGTVATASVSSTETPRGLRFHVFVETGER